MTGTVLALRQASIFHEADGPAVLEGISFSIQAGERVALLGLNGSGKTSLLMGCVGLLFHRGEVEIAGIALGRQTLAQVRRQVGFLFNVPEDQLLLPRVIEDVAFGLLQRGLAAEEARRQAERVLQELGISRLAGQPLHHLSHGQKLRVALAGALVTRPQLLLLDEPSAGLDPPGRRRLVELLCRLEAGMLVATHDIDFARQVCRRFLVLDRGQLVYDGDEPGPLLESWK
ncbi:MAG: cobalt ABC transporter ATP-binding protein [Deltaproteobacteria bacterium]|nr:MAG: cobalt ABC transporter ATP-binding protein [Deltaproteobacteria bacterium]